MQLGHYELTTAIGAGGMGEVWRARDERLGRDVAVKVLPATFANDPERVKRFEQEARAAGSLNHPNLVTIFDAGTHDGTAWIAMELLEGETIREKLHNGARIPLRKAVDYSIQIANGLAAAHEKGIIHRDLKPENLFVCRDGRVKILDFGLAKLTSSSTDPDAKTERLATTPGVVMGTVAYMSPEQVRAQKVDHRSDIFSFGAILFEMVTGKRAFGGETAADLMSAILHSDPPELTTISGDAPPALSGIVRHCLEKSPDERFQSVRDLGFHLQSISGSSATSRAGALPATSRSLLPMVAASVAAAIAIAAALFFARSGYRIRRLQPIVTEGSQLTFQPGPEYDPSIAPDGKTFVYASGPAGGDLDIYLQRIDGRNAINITKDSHDDDWQPTFSPDGSQIAFRSNRSGGGIFVMGATGEAVRRISDFGYNPSWSADASHIVVSTESVMFNPRGRGTNSELWIVDVHNGSKRLLTREGRPVQPSWSPHGDRIAYWTVDQHSQRDIVTIDARNPNAKPVALTNDSAVDWSPMWSPDGRFLYFCSDRGGTFGMWRVAIDEKSGTPKDLAQPVNVPARFASHFTIDKTGTQILFPSYERFDSIVRAPLAGGEKTMLAGGSMPMYLFDVARDGRLVWTTFDRTEDLWVANADGSEAHQITEGPEKKRGSFWTPDGRILYYSNKSGTMQSWQINADGTGQSQITDFKFSAWYPQMSPDGRMILGSNESGSFIYPSSLLPAKTATPLPTCGAAGYHFVGFGWSADSRYIVGDCERDLDEEPQPKTILYDTLTRKYEVVGDAYNATWMPDGRSLLLFKDGKLKRLDLGTRVTTPLPIAVESAEEPRFLASQDGKYVYWLERRYEGDIWRVTLADR